MKDFETIAKKVAEGLETLYFASLEDETSQSALDELTALVGWMKYNDLLDKLNFLAAKLPAQKPETTIQ